MEDFRREMFKLWKASWESYAKSVRGMSDQGEKMMEMFFTQGDAVKDEARKVYREISANTKTAQENYLKTIEENLAKMEEMLKGQQ